MRMNGNVCHYYQSFVGRDFKAWAQKAVLILSPYLHVDDTQKKVLLSLSKIHMCNASFIYQNCIYLGVPYCLLQLLY